MSRQETATTDTSPESDGEPIRVVLVGGFLGVGKTTALQTIGNELTERGYTVGMVTNDQASGLVDTSILGGTDGTVVEIPGGCFCCNFEQLLAAAYSISEEDVDVLLAEPVGSCTDLVATVVNPLRSIYADEFSVAPLTAMLDPDRVRSYLTDDGDLPDEVQYILRMQVEEADLVVLNKTDTLSDDETSRIVGELQDRVGDRPVVPVSADRGDGIDTWLSMLFDGIDTTGDLDIDGQVSADSRALTDIDYDTYADGEARLGWVNMTVPLEGSFDASGFQTDLMDRLREQLRADDIEVAHLKFSVSTGDDLAHAHLTSTDSDPGYSGTDLGTVTEGRLVFNARAVGDPEVIRSIATDAIDATAASAGVSATFEEVQAFRPEYPEPVHRMVGDCDSGSDVPGPAPPG